MISPDTGIGVAESGQSAPREAEPTYLSGFGNEFASEAVPGALPRGQNAPQVPPLRPLHRAALGHAVHRAARREPAFLAVPHPPVGDAPPVPPHR